jgi:ABC-2 type transport system permease protein
MAGLAYRSGFFFTIANNLIYMGIAFYLWQSIYGSREIIQGMTFNQTFLYLSLASSIFVLFQTWSDWEIGYQINDGSIITWMIKPLNYQFSIMASALGFVLTNFLTITIPTIIFLVFVFKVTFAVGPGLIFFPIALIFSFLLTTTIDYIVGITCFYTESIWGISITKDVIITFLSGSLIPLPFFPENIRKILEFLPFQAIYHIPLNMVIEPNQPTSEYLTMIGIQLVWVIILFVISRQYYKKAVKKLRIAGG